MAGGDDLADDNELTRRVSYEHGMPPAVAELKLSVIVQQQQW